jgi:phospholipid/cholesterol/gamma-HCH transport system permease protein
VSAAPRPVARRGIGRPFAAARATLARPDIPPKSWIATLGGIAALSIQAFGQLLSPGLSWRREFVRQYIFAFRATLMPATIVAFVIGFSTIGIQGGSVASAFGAIDRISAVAPIAFLRELGPLLTAAIVAGTLGSTITAEIGARQIRQEVEALEILGINPVRNLVLPKILALTLLMPVINLLALWAGIAGVLGAAVILYGSTPGAFFDSLLTLTTFVDLWGSELKLILFGWLIGVIASYKGLSVGGGAEGVGKAVNESVVASLVAIAMVSVVYTQLFLAFYPEANAGI